MISQNLNNIKFIHSEAALEAGEINPFDPIALEPFSRKGGISDNARKKSKKQPGHEEKCHGVESLPARR